jgi:hypothetical protein
LNVVLLIFFLSGYTLGTFVSHIGNTIRIGTQFTNFCFAACRHHHSIPSSHVASEEESSALVGCLSEPLVEILRLIIVMEHRVENVFDNPEVISVTNILVVWTIGQALKLSCCIVFSLPGLFSFAADLLHRILHNRALPTFTGVPGSETQTG